MFNRIILMFSQNKCDFHPKSEKAENLKGMKITPSQQRPTPPFNRDINVLFWLKSEKQSECYIQDRQYKERGNGSNRFANDRVFSFALTASNRLIRKVMGNTMTYTPQKKKKKATKTKRKNHYNNITLFMKKILIWKQEEK